MKIGITIKLDRGISFQSNGMLQNLYFLAKAFNSIKGWSCYFLYSSDVNPDFILQKDKCISLEKYLRSNPFEFDVLILGGFSSDIFNAPIFENTKIIIFHCGATLIDDTFKCLQHADFKEISYLQKLKIDQIWTLPHHATNVDYLCALYGIRNSKIVPYVWDSTFIDKQLSQNGYNGVSHFSSDCLSSRINSINIYEPNNTLCKTCLIPLAIAVEHKRYGRTKLKYCRTFCAEKIVKNEYFNIKCRALGITKEKEYFEFHRRIPFISSLKTLGSRTIILSHQLKCELNYLYLEALYLGLPLLHNSPMISDYGYFYPDSNIKVAEKKIEYIIECHQTELGNYQRQSSSLFNKFNPLNPLNLSIYQEIIRHLLSDR